MQKLTCSKIVHQQFGSIFVSASVNFFRYSLLKRKVGGLKEPPNLGTLFTIKSRSQTDNLDELVENNSRMNQAFLPLSFDFVTSPSQLSSGQSMFSSVFHEAWSVLLLACLKWQLK